MVSTGQSLRYQHPASRLAALLLYIVAVRAADDGGGDPGRTGSAAAKGFRLSGTEPPSRGADAGETAESKAVMDRFRQLGPVTKRDVPAGLMDYLSLTQERQHADYKARAEKLVHDSPDNAAAQVSYLKLLLDDGDPDRVPATARRISALKPGGAVLVPKLTLIWPKA